MPAPHKALFGTAPIDDDMTSAKAIEVAAMLGDSVIGVKHCIDPKSGKISSKTYGMFAVGAACLSSSAIAFGASVHNAAFNKGGLDYTTHVLNKPAYSFRPEVLNPAFDWIAFGGLALGASSLIAGLVPRTRRDAARRTTGSAPRRTSSSHSTRHRPRAFRSSRRRPTANDFVFNYGAGMEGELVLDGQTTSLAELVAAGRARPSMTTAGAIELPIPARARIRARSGQTTFVVSAVPQPRQQPVSLFGALESRTMKYFAGSLVVHLVLARWCSTRSRATTRAANIDVDDICRHRSINIEGTTTEEPVAARSKVVDDDGESGSDRRRRVDQGADRSRRGGPPRLAGAEQAHGREGQPHRSAIARDAGDRRGARRRHPRLDRAAATTSSTSPVPADISSGIENLNAYGQMFGADVGDAAGNFGLLAQRLRHGGGCTQEPCGLVGTGTRYNTINIGDARRLRTARGGRRWPGCAATKRASRAPSSARRPALATSIKRRSAAT